MAWNKTSISSTASLNQIALKFSRKGNSIERSPHMRAKQDAEGQVVIFSKHFDGTKFLAILGNERARAQMALQRKLFQQTIEEKVDSEYREGTADAIKLKDHAPLRGSQIKAALAHAAVAAAARETGLDQHDTNNGVKQAVCQLARDHVYEMKPDTKASTRIAEAKVFMIEKLAEYRLTAQFKDQSAETLNSKVQALKALCKQLQYSPLMMDLNMRVVTGLVSLLKSNDRPSIDNLLAHIVPARKNQPGQAGPAQQA